MRKPLYPNLLAYMILVAALFCTATVIPWRQQRPEWPTLSIGRGPEPILVLTADGLLGVNPHALKSVAATLNVCYSIITGPPKCVERALDDAAVLQSAIGSDISRVVALRGGTYVLDREIRLYGGVSVIGDGATLSAASK
jgi:hypothetical protein